MNRQPAAEEPSMEDILASIRKIIGDDQAAPVPPLPLPTTIRTVPSQTAASSVGQPGATTPAAAGQRTVADQPSPHHATPASLAARMNDVFGPGTISQPRPTPSFTRQSAAKAAMDDDLGDLLADGPSSIGQSPVAQKPLPPTPMTPAPPAARPAAPVLLATQPTFARPGPIDLAPQPQSSQSISSQSAAPHPPAASNEQVSQSQQFQSSPSPSVAPAPIQALPPQWTPVAPLATPPAQPLVDQTQAPRVATLPLPPIPAVRPRFDAQPSPSVVAIPVAEPVKPAPVVIAAMPPVASAPQVLASTFSQAPSQPLPSMFAFDRTADRNADRTAAQPAASAIPAQPAAPSTPLEMWPPAPAALATLTRQPEPISLASMPTSKVAIDPMAALAAVPPSPVNRPQPQPSGPQVLASMPPRADMHQPAVVPTISQASMDQPAVQPTIQTAVKEAPPSVQETQMGPAPHTVAATQATQAAPTMPSSAAVAAIPSSAAALAIGLDQIASRSVADPAAAAPQTTAEPASSDDAGASALGALAAGLAASAKPMTPEILVPADAPPYSTSTATPFAHVDAAPNASADVPPSSPAPTKSTQPPVFHAPTPVSGGLTLTAQDSQAIDNTAAELLRPMLRQWLDDNMPRIVEKALRIELAETALVARKPDVDG